MDSPDLSEASPHARPCQTRPLASPRAMVRQSTIGRDLGDRTGFHHELSEARPNQGPWRDDTDRCGPEESKMRAPTCRFHVVAYALILRAPRELARPHRRDAEILRVSAPAAAQGP